MEKTPGKQHLRVTICPKGNLECKFFFKPCQGIIEAYVFQKLPLGLNALVNGFHAHRIFL